MVSRVSGNVKHIRKTVACLFADTRERLEVSSYCFANVYTRLTS